jgi:hypothetical protein
MPQPAHSRAGAEPADRSVAFPAEFDRVINQKTGPKMLPPVRRANELNRRRMWR